jgi:hypothetical protein
MPIRPVRLTLLIVALIIGSASSIDAQSTTDLEDVESLVYEFSRLEDSGDMTSQARLMVADRWWHNVGGRRTDNAVNMKIQNEAFVVSRKRYPGLQVIREVRDLKTRLIAPTVAVASFTWVANRIIPPDLPSDKVQALGPAPIPVVVSMVWVKQADGWKIVNTHNSPLYLR